MLSWEKNPNPKQIWDWRLFSGYLLVCNFCHLLSLRGSLTVWLHSCKNWEATHKLAKRNRRICPSYNFGTSVICFFSTDLFRVFLHPKMLPTANFSNKITKHELFSLHHKVKTDFCTHLHKQETESSLGEHSEVYLCFSCAFRSF